MPSIQAGFKSGLGGESPADLLVRLGPTIQVDIGLKSRAAPGQPPDLAAKKIKALIDTGAGGDCIDDDLARRLGLPIHDEGEISGVGGRHRAFIYTARIYVPKLDKLLFQPFTGVKLYEGEQWRRVILGRSFLRQYRLAYDGAAGRSRSAICRPSHPQLPAAAKLDSRLSRNENINGTVLPWS